MGLFAIRRMQRVFGFDKKDHSIKKESLDSSSNYQSDDSSLDNLTKYLMMDFSDSNSELYLFFDKLFSYISEIIKEDNSIDHSKAMETISSAISVYEFAKEKEKELAELGIKLDGEFSLSSFQLSNLIGGKKFQGYNTFNGIRTDDMRFEYDGLSLSELKKQADVDVELEKKLLIEKEELQRKLRFPFSRKEEINGKINEIEHKIQENSEDLESVYDKIGVATEYQNLNESQKQAISDYLLLISECRDLFDEANLLFININRRNSVISKDMVSFDDHAREDIYLRALNRYLNAEGVSLNYIKMLFSKIEDVSERMYDSSFVPFYNNTFGYSFELVVSWFIQNIYTGKIEFIDTSDSKSSEQIQSHLDALKANVKSVKEEISNFSLEVSSRKR